MNNYKSFSELKEELGNNYDFKLYEMGISALKEIENLQQENKKQKEVIDKAINDLNIILEIIREQPSENDCWIINRLEANKKILKEVQK